MFDDRYLIESDGRVAGVAVRVRGGYMFFSSDPELKPLEGSIYPHARTIGRRVAEFLEAKGSDRSLPLRRHDGRMAVAQRHPLRPN